MLPIHAISDPAGPPPGGAYTPALRVGNLVFISGQGPLGPDGKIVSSTIEEETRLTLANVARLLRAAGADLNRVVKTTCYLADGSLFARFNAAYAEAFAGHLPCRTTVAAGLQGILVEIDAIAVVED